MAIAMVITFLVSKPERNAEVSRAYEVSMIVLKPNGLHNTSMTTGLVLFQVGEKDEYNRRAYSGARQFINASRNYQWPRGEGLALGAATGGPNSKQLLRSLGVSDKSRIGSLTSAKTG